MSDMRQVITVALTACAIGYSQAPAEAKVEFEAVSIKAAAPQSGHFFRAPASSTGGPGTADPALFRCVNCNVGYLIAKAFDLQKYQFPGQAALPDTAFDILARVPEGATPDQFQAMLRTVLQDRFHLASHYEKKPIQGYELVVAKGGSKLKESTKPPGTEPVVDSHQEGAARDWHGGGASGGGDHARNGLTVFHGQGTFRGERQTMADLARIISSQLAKPIDDRTGLQGKYDITLTWVDDGAGARDANHAGDSASGGGAWSHGDRGGGSPQGAGAFSGPTLMGALPAQLGLKLEPTKATANVFVVDRVDKDPTAN